MAQQQSSEELLHAVAHSPVHLAVARRDHCALRRIVSELPKLGDPAAVVTEQDSLREEAIADTVAAVADNREVPNRETPLHIAVRLGDTASTEILMRAGANPSLQNQSGWGALQEAICLNKEEVLVIIMKYYHPMGWAKWCRRLPMVTACLKRMRDFYMEIHFEFQSSMIPFVSRIAPSDTYRIWKRDGNLRADTSLAGFDGFKIQRADQSFLFLGEGLEDGRAPPGSLLMISHKEKEVLNAFEEAGKKSNEHQIRKDVKGMLQSNVYRPGIDVTQAELVPQLNWRKQHKVENVGKWKAKVYDMHNVTLSFTSRKISGNASAEIVRDEFGELMTEDEKQHLDHVIKDSNGDFVMEDCFDDINNKVKDNSTAKRMSSVDNSRKSVSINAEEIKSKGRISLDAKREDIRRKSGGRGGFDFSKRIDASSGSNNNESVYKKGLRPVIWLSDQFPSRTDEILPLLDILANKVKAIRRLRDILTTKIPQGTFPVKIAIPVVPTIRVVVTFTKFEELSPLEDEFSTPPTSPKGKSSHHNKSNSSWLHWRKNNGNNNASSNSTGSSSTDNNHQHQHQHAENPFAIPSDYAWTSFESKRKEKSRNSRSRRDNSSSVDSRKDLILER